MRNYLKKGTVLNNYTIDTILGEGATSVAYSCKDSSSRKLVIKEYNPLFINLYRDEKNNLRCADQDKKLFEKGKERFIRSIKRQIQIRSGKTTDASSINNQVIDITHDFEWFGTYYSVMPEFSGVEFTKNTNLSLYNRIRSCRAVAQYVNRCHIDGYLCLDIKPSNIFVLTEVSEFVMFFDFDSVVSKEEVQSGYPLSCSEQWAAPELLIPSESWRIREATDIYSLGELVFWSVFNRHSFDEEHRSFSEFPFDDSPFASELDQSSRDILSELFHQSIRSNDKKRYQNVKAFVEKIDELLVQVDPQKPRLITSVPRCLSHFLGRNDELDALDLMLKKKRLAILSGLDGLGKSEIAMRYCSEHRDYNFVFVPFCADLITTIVRAPIISSMEQRRKETDLEYFNRKIDQLSVLCDERTLLVIDNINVEFECIQEKDILNRIMSLDCSLLITTSCNQESYGEYQIRVNELDEIMLRELYFSNSPFEESQNECVNEIIRRVGKHTLLVDLYSRLAKIECLNPSQVMERINQNGLLNPAPEKVKWKQNELTIEEHIRALYEISEIDEKQLVLLYQLSLMPFNGIEIEPFCEFFKVDNHNSLNDLINRRWVIEEFEGYKRFLRIHPLIAPLTIKYVDERYYDDRDLLNTVYERMESLSLPSSDKSKVTLAFALSIANQMMAYGTRNLFVANFLLLLINIAGENIPCDFELTVLRSVIGIYNDLYKDNYAIPREKAVLLYVQMIDKNQEESRTIIREHLKAASEMDNCRWYIEWFLMALETCSDYIWKNRKRNVVLYSKSLFRYSSEFISITSKCRDKKDLRDYADSLAKTYESRKRCLFECDYPSWVEYDIGDAFIGVRMNISKAFLGKRGDNYYAARLFMFSYRAILRKKTSEDDIIRYHVSASIVNICRNQYSLAASHLREVISHIDKKTRYNLKTIYFLRKTLGKIYLLQSEYEHAIDEFEFSSRLEKEQYSDEVEAQLLYIYACLKKNRLSYELITPLLDDERWKKRELLFRIVWMTYYIVRLNNPLFDLSESDKSTIRDLFDFDFSHAIDCWKNIESSNESEAYRGMLLLAHAQILREKGDNIEAVRNLKCARKCISRVLGKKHPLYVTCSRLYSLYKRK